MISQHAIREAEDSLCNLEGAIMDIIRESCHIQDEALRDQALRAMGALGEVYRILEWMGKENAAPSAATPESGKE